MNDFSPAYPVAIIPEPQQVIICDPAQTLRGHMLTDDEREALEEANRLTMAANTLMQRDRKYVIAIALLRRALAFTPKNGKVWSELGVAYHALGRMEEAVQVFEYAIELDPTYDNGHSNLALLRGVLDDWRCLDEMRRLAQQPDRAVQENIHLALTLLHKGDWDEGLRLYEKRVGVMVKEFKLPKLGVPYWDGETDLNGKSLYVQTEQGIGDSVACVRFVAWVKERYPDVRITLNVHGSYQNLFWEFREIVSFVPCGVLWPEEGSPERWDYGCYLSSLLRPAGTTVKSVYPDPGYIRKRVDMQSAVQPLADIPEPVRKGGRKVGIVWTGNPENVTQSRRSVPLETLLYLLTDPDNYLYSLQCGVGKDDLYRLGAQFAIEDLSDKISPDLVLTGVAIQKMDVIVTCCTSVAHLAGALGKRCFVMLCYDAFWMWGREPETTAWYPSVRLFRQKRRGDWEQVVSDVSKALKELDHG